MSEAPAKTWSLAQALDAVSVEKLEAALRSATISATGCVDGGERRIISAIEWDDYRILLERSFFLNNDFFGGPPTIIVRSYFTPIIPGAVPKRSQCAVGDNAPVRRFFVG